MIIFTKNPPDDLRYALYFLVIRDAYDNQTSIKIIEMANGKYGKYSTIKVGYI
jgi:hypothetical protein